MFRNRSTARYALLVGSSALLLVAVSLPAQGAPKTKSGTTTSTTTAQAVNVEIKAASSFEVIDNQTYAFNEATANSYFTTEVSLPVVICSGGGKTDPCVESNKPSPTAPPADDSRRNSAAYDNMCTFLSGGPLQGVTYPQAVTVKGLNGSGNWTFTWTYTVTPTSASVAPFTAWDLVEGGAPGTAHVVVNGSIAAESTMTSASFPGSPGKASFSLDPTRIQNLAITVTGTNAAGAQITPITQYPTFGIVQGVDFSFLNNNGGSNGTNTLLYGPSAYNDVLLKDGTSNNDSMSNLYFAALNAVGFDLPPGNYTFTLTGSVKDVATNTAGTFSIQHIVHINSQGCGTTS